MTKPPSTRRQFQRTLFGAMVLSSGTAGWMGLSGCTPTDQTPQDVSTSSQSSTPRISDVPLRIWVAGAVRQPETIVRQWNANSEQPIDIRSLSIGEFLALEKCDSDVVLYPSRLLGELLKRQWIDKLPSGLLKLVKPDQENRPTDWESDTLPAPLGLVSATSYNGTMYGLPLGYSMINLLGSSEVKATSVTWEQLSALLQSIERRPLEIDPIRLDSVAMVDRFLSVAFGMSENNPKYGVLFDIRTMKARLSGREFQFAGELLQALACQIDAIDSVVGSHNAAWRWVNQIQPAAYALISPSHLDSEQLQLDMAQPISVIDGKSWNDGSGIIGSVSSQCQQTAQATSFLQWIYRAKSLESLRGLVPGLIPTNTRGSTLVDRIVASNSSDLQKDDLTSEPRMAGTENYRAALAEQLLRFLRGECSCQEALAAAAAAWDKVTLEIVVDAKADYEKSLGLRI